MIGTNFTFRSAKWDWLKDAVSTSIIATRDENRSSIFFKEKLLAERLVEGDNGERSNDAKRLETWFGMHSESTRAAVIVTEGEQENYEVVAPMFGYDVVFVQERFLILPLWWSFSNVNFRRNATCVVSTGTFVSLCPIWHESRDFDRCCQPSLPLYCFTDDRLGSNLLPVPAQT